MIDHEKVTNFLSICIFIKFDHMLMLLWSTRDHWPFPFPIGIDLTSNLPTMPWSRLGATTIPFLGAVGSSVHFAGIHLGTELQEPLPQVVVRLVVSWNWDRHCTAIDWLWPNNVIMMIMILNIVIFLYY